MWNIWKMRNTCVFRQEEFDLQRLIQDIIFFTWQAQPELCLLGALGGYVEMQLKLLHVVLAFSLSYIVYFYL